MNIAIIIQAFLPKMGGSQVSTHCLATSLVEQGHDVTIFTDPKHVAGCQNNGWEFNYRMAPVNAPPQKLLNISYRAWLFLLLKSLKVAMRGRQYDIIQLINAWPWISGIKYWNSAGIPVVLRAVGDDIQIDNTINYGIRQNKKVDRIISANYRYLSKVVANSKATSDEYRKIGVPEDKIAEITPGVNFSVFTGPVEAYNSVRSKYGIPETKKILLAVGRNHPKKGYVDLVKSLEFLNQKSNEYVLIIVGKHTGELKEAARSIGQDKNFFPINEISSKDSRSIVSFPSGELIELYHAADYFIMPSYIETFGNVKLEAMAAGLPVIVTDTPGTSESVVNRRNGMVVPAHSPAEIAQAVRLLGQEKNMREELIKNGRNFAQSQDWKIVAGRYVKMYEGILNLV